MTRLTVENVHRLSSRPWLFVTGELEGDPLQVGDELTFSEDDPAVVVVRAIEFHGAPTKTTIAVDGPGATSIAQGVVLTGAGVRG
ncbi:hypothetical protein KOI35_41205 [Actinoplanes bogorensis]|uniref:Uncharacterized protein n=1 Tax=Paractinoplanes bogorensis TaxID=1610840 RepID=A0ABS5Z356_9ACTN|nr:hypothetical protein [Actinoplanes bogorensis]MBU2669946.1 hypothetical protein [Actinoplanes bogorensis]